MQPFFFLLPLLLKIEDLQTCHVSYRGLLAALLNFSNTSYVIKNIANISLWP
jgi:hypothetical protein